MARRLICRCGNSAAGRALPQPVIQLRDKLNDFPTTDFCLKCLVAVLAHRRGTPDGYTLWSSPLVCSVMLRSSALHGAGTSPCRSCWKEGSRTKWSGKMWCLGTLTLTWCFTTAIVLSRWILTSRFCDSSHHITIKTIQRKHTAFGNSSPWPCSRASSLPSATGCKNSSTPVMQSTVVNATYTATKEQSCP